MLNMFIGLTDFQLICHAEANEEDFSFACRTKNWEAREDAIKRINLVNREIEAREAAGCFDPVPPMD